MYDKGVAGLGAVATAGTVSALGANLMWAVLGGFALFAAAQALLRVLPRSHG